MVEQPKTTIFITPEEALLWLQFQKRFSFMQLLEKIGAFDIKGGSLEIHFDNLGGIAKVDLHQHYKVLQ